MSVFLLYVSFLGVIQRKWICKGLWNEKGVVGSKFALGAHKEFCHSFLTWMGV